DMARLARHLASYCGGHGHLHGGIFYLEELEMDRFADLRKALEVEPESDDWICASYGPKTVGVGVSGGPALLMVRPSGCIDHGDMRRVLHGLIMSRRHIRALLAERDALREAATTALGHISA